MQNRFFGALNKADQDPVRSDLFRYVFENFDCDLYSPWREGRPNGVAYGHVETPLMSKQGIFSSQFDPESAKRFTREPESGKFQFGEVQKSLRDPKRFLAVLERRIRDGIVISCYMTNDLVYSRTHGEIFAEQRQPVTQPYVLREVDKFLGGEVEAVVLITQDRIRSKEFTKSVGNPVIF